MQNPHQIITGGKVYPCHLEPAIVSLPFSPCKNDICSAHKWTKYNQSSGGPGTTDQTYLPSAAPLESGVGDTEMILSAVAKAALPKKTA